MVHTLRCRALTILALCLMPWQSAQAIIADGASLSVSFPGLSGVHTDILETDHTSGTATGSRLASAYWKSDRAIIAVPFGKVDVRIRKGAATYIVDDVDCTGATCAIDDVTATLHVSFAGISSVHTDARVVDGVAGLAGGGTIASSNWKHEAAEFKILRQVVDVRVRKGAAVVVVDDVDCRSGSCAVDGLTADMTVNFPGLSGVHTDVRLSDDQAGAANGDGVTSSNWKTDTTAIKVFRGRYDLRVRKGAATHIVDDVDCTSGACTVDGLVANMTVNFPGLSGVHTDVRLPDGQAGAANGGGVTSSNWKTDATVIPVFARVYDLVIRKGASSLVVDDIDCTSGACTVDGLVANMTVSFPGLSGVHTDVRLSDDQVGAADGDGVTSSNWKTDATAIKVFRGRYDLRVRKGAAIHIVDDVDCTSGACTVDGLVANMTVSFPGLSGVHTDVRLSDDQVGTADGDGVTSSNWKTDATAIKVFRGRYDLRVRKGAATHIVDDVDCTSGACTVDGLVANMTVNFPGLSGVHTDVRLSDGQAGAADGGGVNSSNWKTDATVIPVFAKVYDLVIRKGASSLVVDDVDCTSGACIVDGLVHELVVEFEGLSGVHTDVRAPDGEPGAANGKFVTSSNWKRDSTTIKVFRGVYDLRIRKGAATLFVDDVDCRRGACRVDGITAEMIVEFSGISGVHTDVRIPDGEIGNAGGAIVTSSNWKTDATTIRVFRQKYDVRIRKGAAAMVVDDVDCRSGSCRVADLVADLTVRFPGMSSVHTDVHLADDAEGVVEGGKVTSSNWKRDETTIRVLRQRFDLRVRKGAADVIVDGVDCRGASCSVDDLTATLTVRFPGLSGVHTDVRLPDGVDDAANGDVVTTSNWKAQQTDITVFRQVYDLKVRHGATSVFDGVDCRSGQCDALVAGNVQMTLIDGDFNMPLTGRHVQAYSKQPDGKLVYQASGNTSSDGRIHFTLEGIDAGGVFVLKAINPLGIGKHYFSPFIMTSGPQDFVVTRDGENTLDLEAPVVFIGQPLDLANVSINGFTVRGEASDNRAIDTLAVTVDSGGATTTLAAQFNGATGSWQATIPGDLLSDGVAASIQVTATDQARNAGSDAITVVPIIDNEGPQITFTSHQDDDLVPVTGFLLSGNVTDLTGIDSLTATVEDPELGVTVNGEDVDFSNASGAFTLAVQNGEVSENATVTIAMTAVDSDGNASTQTIRLIAAPVSHAGWQVLNRVTFGPTPALLEELATIGIDSFIEQQLDPSSIDDSAFESSLGPDPTTLAELQAWTLRHMILSRRQLREVLTWFWDNHFNTDLNTTRTNADGDAVSDTVAYELAENQAFRANALGNFGDLLSASAKSPAMLIYLDGISNVAENSNENHARELLELHAMGVDGGYTEADVAAAAEVLTGWHLDTSTGEFFFDATRHNFADQVVLGETFGGGLEQGEAMLDHLARHPATAQYVCGKLVEVFVNDAPPEAMISRCAQTFLDNSDSPEQIAEVMRTILSNEFFDIDNFRAKIKTPVEFVVGAVRNLLATSDGTDLADPVADMGLRLYQNPVPTGYSEIGGDWINSSLLIERIKWVNELAREPVDGAGTGIDPANFFASYGFETAEGIVGFLLNLTVGDDFTDLARQQALDLLNGVNGFDLTDVDARERLRQLIGVVLSYPGYQFQ